MRWPQKQSLHSRLHQKMLTPGGQRRLYCRYCCCSKMSAYVHGTPYAVLPLARSKLHLSIYLHSRTSSVSPHLPWVDCLFPGRQIRALLNFAPPLGCSPNCAGISLPCVKAVIWAVAGAAGECSAAREAGQDEGSVVLQ